MGRPLKHWIGRITSHGVHMFGRENFAHGVKLMIELEDEPGQTVEVPYTDPDHAESIGLALIEAAMLARSRNISLGRHDRAESGGTTDAHTERCCDRHGCHYGLDESVCPVTSRAKTQSFLCEQCCYELEEVRNEIKHLTKIQDARARARRKESMK